MLSETQSRAAGVPDVVEPIPAQHNLATNLAETRDEPAATGVLHCRLPAEDGLARKMLAEEGDALGLDGQEVGEAEAALEHLLVVLEILVEVVALDPAGPLLLVEPELEHARIELGGTGELELWVQQLLYQARIARLDLAVHPDDGVEGQDFLLRLHRHPAGPLGDELAEFVRPLFPDLGVDEVADELQKRSDDLPERLSEHGVHGQLLLFKWQAGLLRMQVFLTCQSGGSVSW